MGIKKVTPYLKPGDTLEGRVRECLDNEHLIVSFEGDLLNVHNQSRQSFAEGDVLALRVESIRPLRFKIVSERLSSWKV